MSANRSITPRREGTAAARFLPAGTGRRRSAALTVLLACVLLAGPWGTAAAGTVDELADSLRQEIEHRLLRVTELRDSLVASRNSTADSLDLDEALAGLEDVVQELSEQVRDLDLQIDERSILLSGPSGRIHIEFPEEWGRKVSESLGALTSSLLAEIPADSLRKGIRALEQQAREIGRRLQAREQKDTPRVVGDDLVRTGGSARLAADERLTGDLVVLMGDADVDGTIDGDAIVIGGDLRLGPNARVGGDVVVVIGSLERDTAAEVDGSVVVVMGRHGPKLALGCARPFASLFDLAFQLAFLLVAALLVWLVLLLLPSERLRSVEAALSRSPGGAVGIGLLWVFLGHVPLLLVVAVLVLTIIGIPLALLLLLAYVMFGLVALAVVARLLGRRLCLGRCTTAADASWLVLPGLLVLALPTLLAGLLGLIGAADQARGFYWLAMAVQLLVYAAGSGAIFRSRFGTR